MTRHDGRKPADLRPIKIAKNYLKYAEGSCLVEFRDTKVICTASVEKSVPPFLRNSGTGWVTAEYGMLPRSCLTRTPREAAKGRQSGRTYEIQRLIGRSMRTVCDLEALGERTIRIDCDVIQADGGTRCASITGSFVALALALASVKKIGIIDTIPLSDYVAAVSVGIQDGTPILDLDYEEDSKADVDMNIVMTGSGKFIEVQGTAEKKPFSKKEMDGLIDLAQSGIKKIISIQKRALKGIL
ncbi:MAG: ribonuclease PH [Candidatus Omnitrophota bacterium]